ncbi:MAG: hypothetical protein SGJ19_12645 [Planctomycetia bacterium]|nr:hypothetical protein [Planctomycetia bacterium]
MIGVPSKPGSRIFKLVARKNVGIGRETHVEIVPTDDVQIISHQPGTGKGSDEQLPQLPKVGDAVAIRYVVRGELVKARGELTRISADQFAVTEKNFVGKTRSIPVLGELPFVGGMFTHTVFSMQTNDLAIPIADVLSIQVPSSVGLDRHNGGNAPE